MAKGEGAMEASMVKAYVCKAAEWVTREAMQIHGGCGYAEEYTVSRLFVDARVLSIFEGADETLCLQGDRPAAGGNRAAALTGRSSVAPWGSRSAPSPPMSCRGLGRRHVARLPPRRGRRAGPSSPGPTAT